MLALVVPILIIGLGWLVTYSKNRYAVIIGIVAIVVGALMLGANIISGN